MKRNDNFQNLLMCGQSERITNLLSCAQSEQFEITQDGVIRTQGEKKDPRKRIPSVEVVRKIKRPGKTRCVCGPSPSEQMDIYQKSGDVKEEKQSQNAARINITAADDVKVSLNLILREEIPEEDYKEHYASEDVIQVEDFTRIGEVRSQVPYIADTVSETTSTISHRTHSKIMERSQGMPQTTRVCEAAACTQCRAVAKVVDSGFGQGEAHFTESKESYKTAMKVSETGKSKIAAKGSAATYKTAKESELGTSKHTTIHVTTSQESFKTAMKVSETGKSKIAAKGSAASYKTAKESELGVSKQTTIRVTPSQESFKTAMKVSETGKSKIAAKGSAATYKTAKESELGIPKQTTVRVTTSQERITATIEIEQHTSEKLMKEPCKINTCEGFGDAPQTAQNAKNGESKERYKAAAMNKASNESRLIQVVDEKVSSSSYRTAGIITENESQLANLVDDKASDLKDATTTVITGVISEGKSFVSSRVEALLAEKKESGTSVHSTIVIEHTSATSYQTAIMMTETVPPVTGSNEFTEPADQDDLKSCRPMDCPSYRAAEVVSTADQAPGTLDVSRSAQIAHESQSIESLRVSGKSVEEKGSGTSRKEVVHGSALNLQTSKMFLETESKGSALTYQTVSKMATKVSSTQLVMTETVNENGDQKKVKTTTVDVTVTKSDSVPFEDTEYTSSGDSDPHDGDEGAGTGSRRWLYVFLGSLILLFPVFMILGAILGLALCNPMPCMDQWPFLKQIFLGSIFPSYTRDTSINLHGVF